MQNVMYGDEGDYYQGVDNTHESGEWWELQSVHDNLVDAVQSVTTVAFDPWEEIIWAGMDNGRVVAYTVPGMERYTAFHANTTETRQVLVDQEGILALSEQNIRCFSRGGLSVLDITEPNIQGFTCMSWLDAASGTLLVGGNNPVLGMLDITTGGLLREMPLTCGLQTIKRSRAVWCGHTNGTVTLLDPRTLRTEHTLDAHTGSLNDCDSKGDLLVTCGCSSRAGQLFVDPLVRVYDVRTMRSLPPIAFPTGPSMLKFHPKFYSTVVIVSQNGQFQLCDVQGDPSMASMQYYQIDSGGDALTSFDIASTGEGMAFGDAGGYVHQWADRDDMHVNMYSVETELPSPIHTSAQQQRIDDMSVSFAEMGMFNNVMGEEVLLSTWPPAYTYPVGLVPHFIDNALLTQMRVLDFVGYIANPGYERYQMRGQHIGTGYLRPLPGKTPHNSPLGYTMLSAAVPVRPPKSYRWVEIKHSKLIFDDFEFGRYNRTTFAGLENSLPNSYCNSCLQVLYFIQLLRVSMLGHLCTKEFCLSCELGFLFHMIEQASGTMGAAVQANNFLRAFRQIPQAAALGLFQAPELTEAQPLALLIESFNRFILEQIHKETSVPASPLSPPSSVIDTLFGTTTVTTTRCLTCGHTHERTARSFQFELIANSSPPPASFSQAVASALCRDTPTKAWCERCCHYQPSAQHKAPVALPHILCLTASSLTPTFSQLWRTSIPSRLMIRLDSTSRQVAVEQDPNEDGDSIYVLSAVVSHIIDPSRKAPKGGHIVAEICVAPGQWYLFNDFCINPSTEQNVTHFDPTWKAPCVFYFTRRTLAALPIPPAINPITKDVLFATSPFSNGTEYTEVEPLGKDEIPGPGDIVAVDAEFVSLGAEETELRSDGTRVVVNPAHFSLARVSVVRGDGPKAGIPLIDDYIVTPEPITDYLTKFSGIERGDLDPAVSTKPLTTLKAVYLKLRYLVDHHVKLVGHGLAKDFRIINIIVPPSQVIDTVELFNIKRQRKISLKFLASYLLNIDIQSKTHNSIEDACTALALSRVYTKLVDTGQFDQTLQKIYQVGRNANWNAEAVHHNLSSEVVLPDNTK